MATADRNIFGGVNLHISDEEARTLSAIFHRIGGNPLTGPRKHANSIQTALAGVGYRSGAESAEHSALTGTLHFTAYEPAYTPGKAYKDADGDVFIRSGDSRWVDWSGYKQSNDYPSRPLKLLSA